MLSRPSRPLIKAIIVVFVWLSVGTIFYGTIANNCFEETTCSGNETVTSTTSCGWNFEQSFYYSVQTGLSIGYGLLSETNDLSRMYSILHVLVGASLVGGALSLFTTNVLAGHDQGYLSDQEKKLARFAHHLMIDGMKGMDFQSAKMFMAEFPEYQRDLYIKLEGANNKQVDELMKIYEAAAMPTRHKLALEALNKASQELPEFQKHKVSIQDFAQMHAKLRHPAKRVWHAVSKSKMVWVPAVALIILLIIGMIFGDTACEWSPITGLYFAVSGLSTGGLQANCYTSGWTVGFVGAFSLLGVPVFGMVLGFASDNLIQPILARQSRQALKERITSAELEFVQHLLHHTHSDRLTLGEYIQIMLVKLGSTDGDTLTSLAADFDRLDTNNSGLINRSEAVKGAESSLDKVAKQEGLLDPSRLLHWRTAAEATPTDA